MAYVQMTIRIHSSISGGGGGDNFIYLTVQADWERVSIIAACLTVKQPFLTISLHMTILFISSTNHVCIYHGKNLSLQSANMKITKFNKHLI